MFCLPGLVMQALANTPQFRAKKENFNFTYLEGAFIQSDLNLHSEYIYSVCVIEPTNFGQMEHS